MILNTFGIVKMLWGERRGHGTFGAVSTGTDGCPMSQDFRFDPSRSLTT
jgi:hypothetical protein